MKGELSAAAVAARLAELRAGYVAMTADEARRALASVPRAETFAHGVARRLAELRALMELSAHLQRARRRDGGDPGVR